MNEYRAINFVCDQKDEFAASGVIDSEKGIKIKSHFCCITRNEVKNFLPENSAAFIEVHLRHFFFASAETRNLPAQKENRKRHKLNRGVSL